MIFFSRKKKIQRDRSAGLVFRWRGGHSGNTGGLTLAVIMATFIFAVAFLGIKVYVSSSSPPSRYRAEVIRVGDVDPDLRWMLERNSPFFCAWEDDQVELAFGSIQSKMYEAIDASRKRKVNWRQAVIADRPLTTPPVNVSGELEVPSVTRHKIEPVHPPRLPSLEWNYVISSSDKLMLARLPKQKSYVLNIRPLTNYQGRTLPFIVNVDAAGKVISALPLEWNTDDEMKLVENWVCTLRFKPLKANNTGVRSLMLNVSIEGRKVEK